ncbi:MAG TPA: G1 family glutamic endopeptidase [Candidatus Paceibacterota bacterium]|jgi:hypothetical protein|nr:G1 family glutamic endopeptidase [Candidatus Paceibacterota bacterium]
MKAQVIKILFAFLLCAVAPHAFAAADDALSDSLSTNWAGYTATGGTYTAVGATWTIAAPATTTTLSTDATWIGVGGVRRGDLLQAGTQAASENGKVQYWAWYELLPDYQQTIPMAVHGGDRVKVSLTQLVDDLWQLSFYDLTTGNEYQKTITYHSSRASAEWIEEMPVVTSKGQEIFAPLSNFGSVTFDDAYATTGGVPKTLQKLRAQSVAMVSRQGHVVLATPSLIDADSFVVKRSSATASVPTTSSKRRSTIVIVWTQ